MIEKGKQLTLSQRNIIENTEFMIGILHTERTSDSMSESLNRLQNRLSNKEYEQLFSVLLTDRGTEFIKAQQFEVNIHTGEIKGKSQRIRN